MKNKVLELIKLYTNNLQRKNQTELSLENEQLKLAQDIVNLLPEYNEILYHAKTLSDEQFREYWDEI